MLETLEVIGEKLSIPVAFRNHHHGDYQLQNTSMIGLLAFSKIGGLESIFIKM
jgi:hypothetical protein